MKLSISTLWLTTVGSHWLQDWPIPSLLHAEQTQPCHPKRSPNIRASVSLYNNLTRYFSRKENSEKVNNIPKAKRLFRSFVAKSGAPDLPPGGALLFFPNPREPGVDVRALTSSSCPIPSVTGQHPPPPNLPRVSNTGLWINLQSGSQPTQQPWKKREGLPKKPCQWDEQLTDKRNQTRSPITYTQDITPMDNWGDSIPCSVV